MPSYASPSWSSIAQDEVRKLSERTRFGFKRAQENSVLLVRTI